MCVPHPLAAQQGAGIITTFAGGGEPSITIHPLTLLNVYADAWGDVYIHTGSGGTIYRVGSDATISLFVSSSGGAGVDLGDGKSALQASIGSAGVTFGQPAAYSGAAVDARGNVYVSDGTNHRIRRVDSHGIIWTTAGTGNVRLRIGGGFSGDGGPARQAELSQPTDVALDAKGDLYVADCGNNRIRRITSDGFISTFAGSGGSISGAPGDGGPAGRSILNAPLSVAVDVKGNVYFAEYYTHRIRQVTPDQVITTFAGTGTEGYGGDGGPASQARLSFPSGVAVDPVGNIYVADQGNHRIRRVDRDGVITTFAGTGRAGFSGDGGPATQAQLDTPSDVSVDSKGNVYAADFRNGRIRRISPLKPLEVPFILLSVASLPFEITDLGATSVQTFTLSNMGNASLSVTRIGVEGRNANQFQISPTSATVPVGVALTVTVKFSPASSGTISASLMIEHSAPGSPSTITLTGSGPERSCDFDGDGKVTFGDFFLFAAAFGQAGMGDDVKFDLNGSGRIDFDDFFLFAEKFGR